ncbi:alpha-1,2-mannosidase, putative subfamily [Mycena capillaripes]|nr:alpha-1,2-mannosidase, putative subfamily [Mycena capillaripes]
MKPQRAVALSALLLTLCAAQDPAQFVNPLIGTKDGGHVFAGATLPWGSVKAGADSRSNDGQAGYVSDGSPISGLSSLHDDGTGGGYSLGNFPFLPLTTAECADNDLTKCTLDRSRRALEHGEPTASPGYFAIPLNNGVNAEMTVTQHTALYRLTYQPGTDQMMVLLDITGDLGKSFHGGKVTFTPSPTAGGTTRVTGSGAFIPSFGQKDYRVYFCFDALGPVPAGDGLVQATYYQAGEYIPLNLTGTFEKELQGAGTEMEKGKEGEVKDAPTLAVRMGISWISTEKACKYAEDEVPDMVALDEVHAAARSQWNAVLSAVEIDATGVSAATQELFWTSLYRTYIAPTNITGDNPLWDSGEPYWDSFYCIWDTFRVVHPLYAITAPAAQAEIVRALIDIYRHEGWLPDCRMSLDKGFTQGGSNADSLLSDSFIKGIGMEGEGKVDWEKGLEAMIKDATVMGDFEVEGRGGINSRKKLGYVPVWDNDHPYSTGANTRSASRLLEYAYNDFSIALVAQGLSKPALAAEYFNASRDWYNIWNPNVTHEGFSGFIQPRKGDGTWFLDGRIDRDGVFRPDHCSPVYGHNECFGGGGGGEFYEASSWEYSFYVPHDMASLIRAMGGKETFSARLDTFFSKGFHDMGDEPGFLPTYLYNYVGQPTKTVDRVDEMVRLYYNTSVNGLPGNDDSGSMGAYAVWSHLGFYPVAGQDTYLLNRPYFPRITLRNTLTGTTAVIIAHNLSPTNIYIQSATLNGKEYTKNWISHDLFRYGGRLELVMGEGRESKWGTGEADVPMSWSTGGFGCVGCVGPVGVQDPSSEGKEGTDATGSEAVQGEPASGSEEQPPKSSGFFSYLIFLLLAD